MVVHIVMFKFHEDQKSENIQKAKMMLEALVEKIEPLNSMEVGIDFNRSERAYDLSLYSTFDTPESLSVYATHPEHLKVVEFIKTVTLESKVVDYFKS